jgi:hypothetical protein
MAFEALQAFLLRQDSGFYLAEVVDVLRPEEASEFAPDLFEDLESAGGNQEYNENVAGDFLPLAEMAEWVSDVQKVQRPIGRRSWWTRQARRLRYGLFVRVARVRAVPAVFGAWWRARPWGEMLMVRKGFMVGVLAGLSAAGSSLWALSSLPYMPGHPIETVTPSTYIPIARMTVPIELAWFFIQFPYVSESSTVRAKNHHTFVVNDAPRHREYVLQIGQRFRRIEIYSSEDKDGVQIQLLTPGTKRTVWFKNNKMVGENTVTDGNLWMWKSPLWNATHLKIYGLADMWLDSPYKRFSCAGFVHRFLDDAGVRVPILDAWDIAKQPWTRVSLEEIEPGDVVTIKAATAAHRHFWHHSVTHVGVYIGHGKIIHAATSSRFSSRAWVKIADLEDFHGRIDKILRPPELQ